MPAGETVALGKEAQRHITSHTHDWSFVVAHFAFSPSNAAVLTEVLGQMGVRGKSRAYLCRGGCRSCSRKLGNKCLPKGFLGQRLLVVHLGHLLVQNEGIDYGDVHKVVKKGPIPPSCFM